MLSTCYFCRVLIKLEFSRQVFEKISTTNFHENLFSGTQVVPRDQTDRHNEALNSWSPKGQACPSLYRDRFIIYLVPYSVRK
jgi:hypothetical protein